MYEGCPTGFVSDCPGRLAAEILGDRWAVSVVWALSVRPRRHGELAETIGGISRKVLTQSLRRLQGYGLVDHDGPEYRLTGVGQSLVEPIRVLTEWSVRHGEAITDFQEQMRSAGQPAG